MSTTETRVPDTGERFSAPVKSSHAGQPLHRLGTVRRQQGVSRRMMARRLKTDINDVQQQERESSDILLSTLYRWQEVLDVPISELLVEPDDELSAPILKRAQMLRMMKTATAILERTNEVSVRRMAQMMVDQIVEIMPELEGIGPWHVVGQRRTLQELGMAAQRCLSQEVFIDRDEY